MWSGCGPEWAELRSRPRADELDLYYSRDIAHFRFRAKSRRPRRRPSNPRRRAIIRFITGRQSLTSAERHWALFLFRVRCDMPKMTRGARIRAEGWVRKPGLRQGAGQFRAHPHAAAKRGICDFAELRRRGCRRGEHLRFSRQRQGRKPGGDWRGDGGERPGHRHRLLRRGGQAHPRRVS